MSHDLWHELRAKNIGGSDIAALFNEGYKTHYQLWNEKRGNIEPDNLEDNTRVQAGKFLEAGIIEWSNQLLELDLYQPHVYVEHLDIEGMGCTPDAYSKRNPTVMAQIKNVDSLQFDREWEHDGEVITKAPLSILLQVQHEMECTTREICYLIVLVGGNRLLYMECHKDEEIGAIIRTKVSEFWISDRPPAPDLQKDGKTIRKVRQKLPITEFADLTDDHDYESALRNYQDAKHARDGFDDRMQVVKNKIFHLSAGNKKVKCGKKTVNFIKKKGTPDHVITEDDIGKVIKGRKDSEYFEIIEEEVLL